MVCRGGQWICGGDYARCHKGGFSSTTVCSSTIVTMVLVGALVTIDVVSEAESQTGIPKFEFWGRSIVPIICLVACVYASAERY